MIKEMCEKRSIYPLLFKKLGGVLVLKLIKNHEGIALIISFIGFGLSGLLSVLSQKHDFISTLFVILGIISLCGMVLSMTGISITQEEKEKQSKISEINNKFRKVGFTDEEIEVRQKYLQTRTIKELNGIIREIHAGLKTEKEEERITINNLLEPMNKQRNENR